MSETVAQIALKGYAAAQDGAAYRVVENAGYIRVAGETRLDYLQRQTSNEVNLLSDGRAVRNVLTSPTGRVLEVFTMLPGQDEFFLLTPPGRGPGLAAYFQKRIFFNDQVEVEDESEDWFSIEIHGPETLKAAQTVFSDLKALASDELFEDDFDGAALRAIGIQGLGAEHGLQIVAPASHRDALLEQLQASGVEELSDEAYRTLRIEAGHSGPPEWVDAYTPFEVGLTDRVSETKGCYTGQEVLARQVTYDKVTRALVRLRAAEELATGAAVYAEDKRIGEITSSALSPRLGPIALAVLRRPYDEGKSALEAESGETRTPIEVIP